MEENLPDSSSDMPVTGSNTSAAGSDMSVKDSDMPAAGFDMPAAGSGLPAACKVTIHMVSSLDGIIAKKDNSVSWFETSDNYEKGIGITEQDTEKFLKAIDCYVMGSRTYEHALELSKLYGWAYGDTPTIVITHRDLPVDRPNIEIYSGDLDRLVNERLKPNYRNVWVVGGAMLAKDFICLKLADEIRLSVMPIILGDGTLFFDQIGIEQALHLKDVTAYKSGMVELRYEIRK